MKSNKSSLFIHVDMWDIQQYNEYCLIILLHFIKGDFVRKPLVLFISVLVIIGISGCSKSENKDNMPTAGTSPASTAVSSVVPSEEPSVAPTAPKVLTAKVNAKIDYTILEEFKVFNQDKGYGALIQIDKDSSKEDIIDLIKKMSENKDPVAIVVFTSKEAYLEYKNLENNGNTTDEFKKGYLASYIKNKTLPDQQLYGENSLTWTQEIGKFADMLFTTIDFDKL